MGLETDVKDIKQQQEKIIAMLDNLVEGKSREMIYDFFDLTQILHVSRRTLFNWKKDGILPYVQYGGKVWVTESQLKRFLEKYSNDPFMSKAQIQKRGSR